MSLKHILLQSLRAFSVTATLSAQVIHFGFPLLPKLLFSGEKAGESSQDVAYMDTETRSVRANFDRPTLTLGRLPSLT